MDKHDDIRRHAPANGAQSRSGDGSDGSPATLLARWLALRAHLSPLIGENGFNALFARAVGLVAPRFGCLVVDPVPKSASQYLAALELSLGQADPPQAQQAEGALMDAFTRQLATMIGPALTERLLAAALARDDGPDMHRSTTK